jgi:hypothetical protein
MICMSHFFLLFPLAFSLLPGRTRWVYYKSWLLTNCFFVGRKLDPVEFHSTYVHSFPFVIIVRLL